MTKEKIVFNLVPSETIYGEFCDICGDAGEPLLVTCKVTKGYYTGCIICERCIGGNVDFILKDHIKRLERKTNILKRFIGNTETPTYDEWLEAQLAEVKRIKKKGLTNKRGV
jgi:hypothetical protein